MSLPDQLRARPRRPCAGPVGLPPPDASGSCLRLLHRHFATGGDLFREHFEVIERGADGAFMSTQCAICSPKKKHWLASLLSQGNEASVILKQCQAIRIRCHGWRILRRFLEHMLAVFAWDSFDP